MFGSQPVSAPRPLPAVALVEPAAAEWDAFVLAHEQGHLLQCSPWGALKERFGWRVARLALAGPGGLLAGAQVLLRSRYGLAAAYVPRGPLLCDHEAVNDLLLAALGKLARRRRAVFLRIEPNLLAHHATADATHTALLLRGWRTAEPLQPRSSIHLDLTPAPDALFGAFSKGHRADIRRAERQGVAVRPGGSAADLSAFFQMLAATSGRKADYALHSEEYYRWAWELCSIPPQPQGASPPQPPGSQLLLAEHAGAVVGACMVFAAAGQGLYLYGGSSEAGLKLGANHLLQWRGICWAREQGCSSYDLWGIPDALGRAAPLPSGSEREALEAQAQQDPLFGVYRFKKGFGGEVVRYLPAYDQVYMPPLYALWRRRMG